MLIRRLARPMLASAFVVDGIDTLMHPESRAQSAATLVSHGEQRLPDSVSAKLPADPARVVRINAVVRVGAGTLLALGRAPRLAAVALAASVVPAAVTESDFWNESDAQQRAAKRTAFLKDVGLLGGLLIASTDTEGKPSLGWRGRRAARRAAAALPFTATSAETVRDRLQQQAGRGREFAAVAADKGADLATVAQSRGGQLAGVAREHGIEWADSARHRGAELAGPALDHRGEWAQAAKRRGESLAAAAREHGGEWAEAAKRRGANLANSTDDHRGEWAELAKSRGAEWAGAAREHGGDWAETAKDRGSAFTQLARERAEHAAEAARRRLAETRDQG